MGPEHPVWNRSQGLCLPKSHDRRHNPRFLRFLVSVPQVDPAWRQKWPQQRQALAAEIRTLVRSEVAKQSQSVQKCPEESHHNVTALRLLSASRARRHCLPRNVLTRRKITEFCWFCFSRGCGESPKPCGRAFIAIVLDLFKKHQRNIQRKNHIYSVTMNQCYFKYL